MLINKINIGELSNLAGHTYIPLSLNFSPETQQYENIESSFNLESSDIINDTIDYEKVKVYPIGASGGTVDAIRFKLHFYSGSTWDSLPSKINSIGFTEDDVRNKRKRLENTFIRLSFYDSKDLKTQNLLYYSTIFVDCDTLYSEYIKNNSSMSGLTVQFLVENPKLSTKIKSFEGYALYLFKNDLSKKENTNIYMRVDFNNAFNGRSTLFTKIGTPLKNDGYTMVELINMMFFDIICKFDSNKNNYVGYLDGINEITNNSDDVRIKKIIDIDLYQAKVI